MTSSMGPQIRQISGGYFVSRLLYIPAFLVVNPQPLRRGFAPNPTTPPKRVWEEQVIPSSGRVGPFCLRSACLCKASLASLGVGYAHGLANAQPSGIGPLRWLRRGYDLKPSHGPQAPLEKNRVSGSAKCLLPFLPFPKLPRASGSPCLSLHGPCGPSFHSPAPSPLPFHRPRFFPNHAR